MSITDNDDLAEDHLADEVRMAFAEAAGMRLPLTGIQSRARGRARRTMAAVAVVTALSAAGAFGGVAIVHRATAAAQPVSFDQACQQQWGSLASSPLARNRKPPPVALVIEAGTPGAMVYADSKIAALCERTSSDGAAWLDLLHAPGTQPDHTSGLGLMSLGTGSVPAGLSPGLIWGGAPADVIRVDLRLDSGRLVNAVMGNGYYGYLDPSGNFGATVLAAVRSIGIYLSMPSASRQSPGSRPGPADCAADITTMLARAPDLTAAQRAQHPHLLTSDLYADDRGYFDCGPVIEAWLPAVPFSAQRDELSLLLPAPANDDHKAVGHAPAGTQHVDVVFTDGSSRPASLINGFYYAAWPGDLRIDKVVAYTADKVYTHRNGVTTVAPR